MKAIFAFAAVLLAVVCLSSSASANQVIINAGQNQTTVHVNVDDAIIIQLEGHGGTTGHHWMLDFMTGPAVIQNGKPSFDPSGHGHGKKGVYNFPFLAVQTGFTTVRLEYARKWEASPKKWFQVNLSVQQ